MRSESIPTFYRSMGYYTGIRVRGQLKPEFVPIVEFILANPSHFRSKDENPWLRAKQEFSILTNHEGYSKFVALERSECIPGMFSTVGDWKDEDPEWQTSVVDDYFVMQSVIKNYGGELWTFVEHLVPLFFSSVDHCEIMNEDSVEGLLYALEDGKMVEKAQAVHESEDDDWRGMPFGYGIESKPKPVRWQSPWQCSRVK